MKKSTKYAKYRLCKKRPVVIVLLCIFSISNLLFFYFIYKSQNAPKPPPPQNWPPQFVSILQRNFRLFNDEWRLTSNTKKGIPKSIGTFDCKSVQKAHNKQFIATGWTKATYKGAIDGTTVAIKNVNLKGYDVTNCMDQSFNSLFHCYMKSATKLLREIVRLHIVQHPNIIKILGYCVPEYPTMDDHRQISIITELGEVIDVIKLLQMSWNDRLKLSLDIAKLINHLSDTPLGSITLNDFRRQQFVFVGGTLKLVDIDDIGTENPSCNKDPCCIGPMKNISLSCVDCDHGICKGYNEKLNIINAGRHFIKHILPHSVPGELIVPVNAMNEAYHNASWDSFEILQKTIDLMRTFIKSTKKN